MSLYTKENDSDPKKDTPAKYRLPYALAKERGIHVPDGATPSEVWQLLQGYEVNPDVEYQKMLKRQRARQKRKERRRKTAQAAQKQDIGTPAEQKRLRELGIADGPDSSPYDPQAFVKTVQERLKTERNPDLRQRLQEYIEDVKHEPQISADMQQIAQDIDSALLGFEFRLKTPLANVFTKRLHKSRKSAIKTMCAIQCGLTIA